MRVKASLDRAYFQSFCQFWALRSAEPIQIDIFFLCYDKGREGGETKERYRLEPLNTAPKCKTWVMTWGTKVRM